MGLGGNYRQIFEFKGVIRKIFRDKGLGCQRALKIGLGQLRGPSWEAAQLFTDPIRSLLSRKAGLRVGDNAHSLGVMKKVKDTQSLGG